MSAAGEAEPGGRYALPDSLPPPRATGGWLPLLPLVYGALAAGVLGVVLFVGCYVFYVYGVYSVVLGIMLGMAIGRGVRQSGYSRVPALFVVTAFCSVLLHAVCNVALFRALFGGWPPDAGQFLDFLWLRAQHETLVAGVLEVDIGVGGNLALWGFELVLMAGAAWLSVRDEAEECRIQAVPPAVAEFVAHVLSEGRHEPYVEDELARRGWLTSAVQRRALVAGRRELEAWHEASRADDEAPGSDETAEVE